jgi:hypothetical protein
MSAAGAQAAKPRYILLNGYGLIHAVYILFRGFAAPGTCRQQPDVSRRATHISSVPDYGILAQNLPAYRTV